MNFLLPKFKTQDVDLTSFSSSGSQLSVLAKAIYTRRSCMYSLSTYRPIHDGRVYSLFTYIYDRRVYSLSTIHIHTIVMYI